MDAETASPLRTLCWTELVLTAIEWMVVVYPLVTFYPDCRDHVELLGPMAAMVGIWLVLLVRQLRPPITYERAQSLPGRALLFRLGLWLILSLGGSLYLLGQGSLPRTQVFTVMTICLVHSLAVALIRWALHKRIMRSFLAREQLLPPWPRYQAETLLDRLIEVAVVVGAATAGFLGMFVFLFVPISLEQFLRMETYFPWTGVVVGGIWYYLVAPRTVARVLDYLHPASIGETPPQQILQGACHTAHRLPFVLALSKIGFFVFGGLLLFVEGLFLFDFSLGQSVLVLCAVVIVTTGAGIYEMIWSRAVIRPVVAYLMAQSEEAQQQVRAQSLRFKMLLSFGGAVVFTVALALFWTYLQYGNLRRDFVATQARREMASVVEKLQLHPDTIPRQLQRLTPLKDSRYLHIPFSGEGPALLPPTSLGTIRRRDEGSLEIADAGLAGTYQRIDPARPRLGSLLVLLPVGSRDKAALDLKVLLFFFVIVLGLSLGLVLLTSADLTHPLARLERRASEMAQGRLDQRVLPGGEFDEIGRLTAAFEQMRQALQDKIQTIEALNIGLEEKVQQRTGELERSNQELVEAMEALKRAQQQLITSEKLASVGQLVAGIAHEINNPVNAVVNTLGPLSHMVEELAGAEEQDPQKRQDTRKDLQAMLRVIQSGAQRTLRIVQALRNYSRQDIEQRSLMDLHADIDETLALLQHRLRDISVQRELTAKEMLQAYRGQLNQVLMNLISNAADAVAGQKDAMIAIRTMDREKAVVIQVEDNGPGISDEILPRIFDPFFTTKEVGKGTGLGLSITQRIVEHHGGEIDVQSRAGQTVFTVTIPR